VSRSTLRAELSLTALAISRRSIEEIIKTHVEAPRKPLTGRDAVALARAMDSLASCVAYALGDVQHQGHGVGHPSATFPSRPQPPKEGEK
jgi:hypothetical protein